MNRLLNRRTLLQTGALAAVAGVSRVPFAQSRPRVVFLNPGEQVERSAGPYWPMVTRFMAAAARSLNIDLEVLYGERDHLLMLRQAEELARGSSPDFVVMVNEKSTAPQMLEVLSRSPAKVLVIHNDLTPQQRKEIGNERERYPRWIGTAVSNEVRGSYRLMEELYRQLGAREPHLIGITGDPVTPVSSERAQGVQDFVDHARRGKILQLAHGDWSSDDAESKARVLVARFPEANIIWAANDTMALGALRAVTSSKPPLLVGGMGGSPDAVQSIANGGLAATAAGHYLIGAWTMVLLHDYANGTDFAAYQSTQMKIDHLYVLNRQNAAAYQNAIFANPESHDFRLFSKSARPRPGPYEFSLERLVRGAR